MKELRNVFVASRPFSWVNTAFPFAAGWILCSHPLTWPFWVGTFFFLFPYNLAMYGINDIFDYESDIRNPRKASIEGAQLRKQELTALWKYIVGIVVPFALVLLLTGTFLSALLFAFSLFMVVAYSAVPFRFKEIAFLDSFTSGCHFVTPPLFAIAYAGGSFGPFVPGIIAFFLWGFASHAFGAIQDIEFDREAGIGSIATTIGARSTLFFSASLYALAAIVTAYAYGTVGIIVGVALALYVVNTLRFSRVTDSTAQLTNTGWRVFLALNMGTGALLASGYLYLVHPAGYASAFPWYGPIAVAIVVFVFFLWIVRARR